MYIEELIPGLNIEDYSNEFKGIIEEGEDQKGSRKEISWLKELCAFANTKGGTLYVGVHDKTHKLLSLEHTTVDTISRMVHRLIKEHVEPYIYYTIKPIPVPQTSPIRYIIAIEVKQSNFPPVSLKFNGIGVIYYRHFGETSIATSEEIRYMVLNSDHVSYDILMTEEKFDMNDFSILNSWYQKANDGKSLSEKDLLNIGFMTKDGYLKKGALLFKDNCLEENTLIECSEFSGSEKGSNTFKSNKKIQGNLLTCYQSAYDFILNHSANGFVKTAEGKKDYFSFPKRSILEGLANAIGHRNYFLQGTQIEVNLYPDRLEIISPGSLLGTRWLKNEKELSKIPPMRRNELICSVLSMLKIMDHKGSGFDKIEEEYHAYGELFAPYADSDGSSFCLTLPDLTYRSGIIKNNEFPTIYTYEKLPGKHDLRILSYCYNSPKSAADIAVMLKIKPSSYFRNNILKPLVEKGYLIINDTIYPAMYSTAKGKTHL